VRIYILLLFPLCVASFTVVVNARTLFIDLNNADSEIKAFNASAVGKVPPIIVLPSYQRIDPKQRKAARVANASLDELTVLAQHCAVSVLAKSEQCRNVYVNIRNAELDRVAATGDYSIDDLTLELTYILKINPDIRFDTLVVSGHHELSYYRGELFQATQKQIVKLVKQFGPAFSRLNMIVLLGCGTGSRIAFTELSALFPNVTLMVGAQDRAPTRDEARNLLFIRKLNASRSRLLNGQTSAQIEPIFRSLLAENWPVSLLWRHQVLFFNTGAEPF
jgi:hypothetical protein